jgi:hypothetical protein
LFRASVANLFNGGVTPLLGRATNYSIHSLRDLEISASFHFLLRLVLELSNQLQYSFCRSLTMGQRHQLFVIAKIGNRYRGLAAVHHRKSALSIYLTILWLVRSAEEAPDCIYLGHPVSLKLYPSRK